MCDKVFLVFFWEIRVCIRKGIGFFCLKNYLGVFFESLVGFIGKGYNNFLWVFLCGLVE